MTTSAPRYRSLLLTAALVLMLAGAGCRSRPAAPAAKSHDDPADTVETVRPTFRVVGQEVEQPGQVEADEQAPLYSRVAGYVKAWHVDVGGRVVAGQLLAELSVPEKDQELRQKAAAVAQARADVALAGHALDAAKANVMRAAASVRKAEAGRDRAYTNRDRWSVEYDRGRRLRPSQGITPSEFDGIHDQYRSAAAALAESKAAVEQAQADRLAFAAEQARAEAAVDAARARVVVAEADRDRMAEVVRFARIVAPFAGVVTHRNIEKGQLVQPPPGGSAGTPLFTVARMDKVRVVVDVPESAAPHVRDHMKAGVRVQALGDRELAGQVARTSWALDTKTRTLRTEVELDNSTGQLRPGMFVSVHLRVERPGTLLVPAAAVYQRSDERPYVTRVQDGKTYRTHVRLGERHGAMVELLRKEKAGGEAPGWEALTGKEELIASNPAAYADGQAVSVRGAARLARDGGR